MMADSLQKAFPGDAAELSTALVGQGYMIRANDRNCDMNGLKLEDVTLTGNQVNYKTQGLKDLCEAVQKHMSQHYSTDWYKQALVKILVNTKTSIQKYDIAKPLSNSVGSAFAQKAAEVIERKLNEMKQQSQTAEKAGDETHKPSAGKKRKIVDPDEASNKAGPKKPSTPRPDVDDDGAIDLNGILNDGVPNSYGEYEQIIKGIVDDYVSKMPLPPIGGELDPGVKHQAALSNLQRAAELIEKAHNVYVGGEAWYENVHLIAESFNDFLNSLYISDQEQDNNMNWTTVEIYDKYSIGFSNRIKKYGSKVKDFFDKASAITDEFIVEDPDESDDLYLKYDDKEKQKRFIRHMKKSGEIVKDYCEDFPAEL